MMMGLGRLSLLLLCVLLVSTAWADSSFLPVASFAAWDHGFEGPDTVAAGLTAFRLQNRGQEPHQLQLLWLTAGRTPADLASYLQASHGAVPQWAKHMGGPNGVGPGDSAEAIMYLEPGTYVITCAIPTKGQEPHAILGMPKTLHVIASEAPQPEFSGHVHMAMFDYEYVVIQDMRSGPQTFYVVNRGNQTHQVSLVQLNPGASADDMLAAFAPSAIAPLPGKLLGGIAGLEPGGRGMFTASLCRPDAMR
jgi:hypothetical protein